MYLIFKHLGFNNSTLYEFLKAFEEDDKSLEDISRYWSNYSTKNQKPSPMEQIIQLDKLVKKNNSIYPFKKIEDLLIKCKEESVSEKKLKKYIKQIEELSQSFSCLLEKNIIKDFKIALQPLKKFACGQILFDRTIKLLRWRTKFFIESMIKDDRYLRIQIKGFYLDRYPSPVFD